MKIAYLLMVHKHPELVDRLIDTLQDGRNYVAVHVDKKAGKAFRREIADVAAKYPNVRLSTSLYCIWCGWSLVRVALEGMRFLLDWADDWDFFVNLSAQDCALQTQDEIRQYLIPRRGSNFVFILELAKWPRGMKLLKYYNLEIPLKPLYRPVPTFIPRPFLKGVVPYAGSAWITLSRDFCDYVTSNPDVERFKRFYRFALVPEEMFFQTVLMNSPFRGTVVPDFRRFIPPFPGKSHPRILTMQDFDEMQASGFMFARKFDPAVDAEVMSRLYQRAKRLAVGSPTGEKRGEKRGHSAFLEKGEASAEPGGP